jgi:glycosyltransferase involved in cell wall biosynthesis
MRPEAKAGPDRLAGVRVLAALNGIELFGHERGNIEVFKTLRDCGAEVVVGTNAGSDNDVDAELRRLGFETFPLPFSNQWSLQWLRKYPRSIGEKVSAVHNCSRIFAQQIKRCRATHIHLGSPLTYSYLWPALARSRTPLIYRMGDCPPVDSRFNLRLWRMAERRSSRMVAISRYVATRAEECGATASKIEVIYNLAPTRSMNVSQVVDKDMPRDLNRIVYVGAIAEHKGLLHLVEAFARLADSLPTLTLDIVGGSRYDEDFRRLVVSRLVKSRLMDRVSLPGHLPNPAGRYAAAGVHVVPSVWEEPAGNVVMEAKMAGTPSVVFPSGGLPEMVRHQVDGFICRDKTVDALVEGLCWCLADHARLQSMGEAARVDSTARFGQACFAAAWVSVYGGG